MSDEREVVWHPEILTSSAAEILHCLQRLAVFNGGYLAGGTGLALRYGHRLSVDLDFFLSDFDEDAILERLQVLPGVSGVIKSPRTLHLEIQGVKASFLGYSYPLLFPAAAFHDIPVADPRDIACMKLTAIASRGTKRDFVDLYAACQRDSLAELLTLFDKKYAQARYSKVYLLKSLTYFEDAGKDPMPNMLVPVEWGEVKRFFLQEVPRLSS